MGLQDSIRHSMDLACFPRKSHSILRTEIALLMSADSYYLVCTRIAVALGQT